MEWYVAYLALGAFTGFLAGLFGIGGGLIFVPLLSALFAAQQLGDSLHLALGTSMATGPGRPDSASSKASGTTSRSSAAERTRKLCLVIGSVSP